MSGWNGSSGLYDESLELSGSLEWSESGFPPVPVLGGKIFPLSPPPVPGSPMLSLLSLLGSFGEAGVSPPFSCGSFCDDGSGALDRSDLCSEIRPSGSFPFLSFSFSSSVRGILFWNRTPNRAVCSSFRGSLAFPLHI